MDLKSWLERRNPAEWERTGLTEVKSHSTSYFWVLRIWVCAAYTFEPALRTHARSRRRHRRRPCYCKPMYYVSKHKASAVWALSSEFAFFLLLYFWVWSFKFEWFLTTSKYVLSKQENKKGGPKKLKFLSRGTKLGRSDCCC